MPESDERSTCVWHMAWRVRAQRKSLNALEAATVRKILLANWNSWLLYSTCTCQHSAEEILSTTVVALLCNVQAPDFKPLALPVRDTVVQGVEHLPSSTGQSRESAKAGSWPWGVPEVTPRCDPDPSVASLPFLQCPYKDTCTAQVDNTQNHTRIDDLEEISQYVFQHCI